MTLSAMREAVYKAKPHLGEIMEEFGGESLLSYREKRQKNSGVPEERKNQLKQAVFLRVENLWGTTTAEEIMRYLNESWYVSTAEHHAPVNHPFVVSGTFIQTIAEQRRGLDTVLVLSCAGISLNNSSYPRGVFYHDSELAEKRINFQPWKHHRHPVWNLQSAKEQSFLGLKLPSADSYADQISLFNEEFYKKIPGNENFSLVYLPQESIVTDLIIKFHLDQPTVINNLLFNSDWQKVFTKYFNGITGAFDSAGHGSWLFWGVKNGQRIKLSKQGNNLVSSDNKTFVELVPGTIKSALENKEIMPTMALSFIVLSFYYGLNCGGGFSQVDYLPKLQSAYLAMIADMGETDHVAENVQTDFLSSDYAFLSLQRGTSQVLAAAMDMFLYGDGETYSRIVKLAETVTLKDALDNLMPEFYAIAKGEKVAPVIFQTIQSCLYV